MGVGFTCRTCGKHHDGLPSFGEETPSLLAGVPQGERERRVSLGTDDCVIDGKHFLVRARLEIPIHGREEPFVWGVWVSLREKSHRRFVELYEDEERGREEPWFGWLCTHLPGYPETVNLKTHVHVSPYPLRPTVELEPTAHPLAVEQRTGISWERAQEIAESLLHG